MYGPVLGMGLLPWSLFGVPAGTTLARGIASCCNHSPSAFVRWNVIVLLASSAITPPLSVHVAAVLRHAAAPTSAPYMLDAVGPCTLKMRTMVYAMSLGLSTLPFENLIPLRTWKTHVLPPSVGFGMAVARSGTTV